MKTVTHKSKVSPKVTYQVSNVAAYRYLTVRFEDKILVEFRNSPVMPKATIADIESKLHMVLNACEMPNSPDMQGAYHDFVAALKPTFRR